MAKKEKKDEEGTQIRPVADWTVSPSANPLLWPGPVLGSVDYGTSIVGLRPPSISDNTLITNAIPIHWPKSGVLTEVVTYLPDETERKYTKRLAALEAELSSKTEEAEHAKKTKGKIEGELKAARMALEERQAMLRLGLRVRSS